MKRRYSDYKDSGIEWIGDIPRHWEVVKLGRHISILSGFPFKSELFDSYEGFPILRIRDITSGKCETFYKGEFSQKQIVTNNDLLIGMDGDFTVRWWEGGDVLLNQRCCCVWGNPTLSKRFLYYSLPDKLMIVNDLTYFTTVKHLSNDDIKSIRISLPPLHEQEAIVWYLDEKTSKIDSLLSLTEKKIELLKEKRTALINHAVTKGLNPDAPMKDSGIEWIGEIPWNWEMMKLKHLGDAIIGLSYNPDDVSETESGILVLRSSNIQNGELSLRDNVYLRGDLEVRQKLIVKVGDLLICSRNGSRSLIGKNIVIDERVAGNTFGAFMTLFRSKHWNYLHKVLNSTLFFNQTDLFLTSTINQLTIDTLNNFSIPFPPLSEQESIVSYLDEKISQIDNLIAIEQKRMETLKEYRQSLISEVVTGKIKVTA
jgi:type I restriction enzyme S subunit